MNKTLNKPIIRATIVILVCIVFISFGLASGADGFWGNLKMIFSAFFSTITFLIGISIAILLSIVILIGLFLAATAIYSPEKARELSGKLWSSTQSFAEIVKKMFFDKVEDIEHSEVLQERKEQLAQQVKEISTKLSHLTEKVTSSSKKLGANGGKDEQSAQEPDQTSTALNENVASLSAEMTDLRHEVQQLRETVEQLSNHSTSPEQPADDIPQALHILRYLENDEDKKSLTDYVNETVRQKLSFAKAREYLLKELPDNIRDIIEEHPRLTKDFIRHQRNELRD